MKERLQDRLNLDTPAVASVIGLFVLAPVLAYAAVTSPKLALVLTLTAVFELALLRRPHWGLYFIVAAQFFDSIYLPAGFAALGLGDFAAFAVLPVWVLHRLIKPQGLRLPKGWQLIGLFVLLTGISVILGVKPSVAYGPYARVVIYAIALMAMVDLAQKEGLLIRVAWIMAVCGTVHAVIALVGGSATMRLGGLFDQPNSLGAILSFGVIPAIGLLLRPQRVLVRALLAVAVSLMLVAIVFTVSRGTYIALSVSLLWWLRRYRRFVIVAMVAGGAAFGVLAAKQEQQVDFISQRIEMDDTSVTNRWQVVQNAFEVIQARPIFGVGFGQFREMDQAVDVRREARRTSHNFYLGMAAASGIPALLTLLWFIGIQVQRMRAASRRAKAAGGEQGEYNAWVVNMLQALALCHGVSLMVRGGSRITEWTMLALYCCAAAYVDYDYGRSTSSSAGGEPSSSKKASSSSRSSPLGSSPSAPR